MVYGLWPMVHAHHPTPPFHCLRPESPPHPVYCQVKICHYRCILEHIKLLNTLYQVTECNPHKSDKHTSLVKLVE